MQDETNNDIALKHDVSIIIVSWNTCHDLRNCLQSLYDTVAKTLSLETIVVDNASQDDTAIVVMDQFPQVRYIQNTDNVGFSAANNVGVRSACGRYVLLLNPDCIFSEDCISPLILRMDSDSSIGLVGCRLLNEDGSEQKSADLFPIPFQEISPVFRARRRALLEKVDLAIRGASQCNVGVVIGAFQFIPREFLLDIGILDHKLFMYGEDLDLCYRIEKAGRRVVLDASVSIIHLGGKSSEQIWSDEARLAKVRQSIFRIHVKHFGCAAAIATLLVRTCLSWVRYAIALALLRSKGTRSVCAAEAIANTRTIASLPSLIKHQGTAASSC